MKLLGCMFCYTQVNLTSTVNETKTKKPKNGKNYYNHQLPNGTGNLYFCIIIIIFLKSFNEERGLRFFCFVRKISDQQKKGGG